MDHCFGFFLPRDKAWISVLFRHFSFFPFARILHCLVDHSGGVAAIGFHGREEVEEQLRSSIAHVSCL